MMYFIGPGKHGYDGHYEEKPRRWNLPMQLGAIAASLDLVGAISNSPDLIAAGAGVAVGALASWALRYLSSEQ